MSEESIQPIQPIPVSSSNQIPERYQKILDILSEYHSKVLQDNTHLTQNPDTLRKLQSLLDSKASEIIYCLNFNKNVSNDSELQECLDKLRTINFPWDAETSINIEYWCDIMFCKYPFTVDPNHIHNLLTNSTRRIIDGEYDTDDEKDDKERKT